MTMMKIAKTYFCVDLITVCTSFQKLLIAAMTLCHLLVTLVRMSPNTYLCGNCYHLPLCVIFGLVKCNRNFADFLAIMQEMTI